MSEASLADAVSYRAARYIHIFQKASKSFGAFWYFVFSPPRVILLAALAIAGCSSNTVELPSGPVALSAGAAAQGSEKVTAARDRQPEARYRRQSVRYASSYPPGTIVVDPGQFYVYLITGEGHALRYGASVGKGAFAWHGTATIGRVAEWPRWTPPAEMIGRSPALSRYAGGMGPGDLNPMGARAIYLFQGSRDTLYRLHGTPEWWTIGEAASSGCIRLMNDDIVDLADRVAVGANVVVLPTSLPMQSRRR